MPHGKGGVSNPVERVVLNIPQSVSDTIANMRRENERLTAIKGEILSELNALNYREKAVIYGFYIDGLQWERLSQRVNYSPRQCRNIRNIALDRLARRLIRTSGFPDTFSRKNKIATYCPFFLL